MRVKKAPSKAVKSRKVVKKYRVNRFRGSGSLAISRKVPMIRIRASGVGSVGTNNATVLTLGVPTSATSGVTGYYDFPFSLEFHLSDLQTYSDITNICDKYKIAGVHVSFLSANNSGFQTGILPYIEIVSDSNDASLPTISDAEQKMGLKTKSFNQQGRINMNLVPRIAPYVYNGASTAAFSVASKPMFVNTGYPNVPHYGLKGIIRNFICNATDNTTIFNIDLTYKVIARDLQ